MKGLMQDWPLLNSKIIEHGANNHSDVEIASYLVEGGVFRYSFAECHQRSKRLAKALSDWGVEIGDRIATLAWNTHRHMECWFGISCMGAVCHTVNPRLFEEQLVFIMNHAGDRILFLDISFVPLIEALADRLVTVEKYIVLTDDDHMPETNLKAAVSYETFIGGADVDYDWPLFDENTAAGLCYTSGTTGNPKGVLYSHRSNFLHAMGAMAADSIGITACDSILPIVPMFHANAWGIPFIAFGAGVRIVLNGPHFDGPTVHKMLEEEKVTITAAVPTVWLMLLQHVRETGGKLESLKKVLIGGAAVPRMMIQAFQDDYGVTVFHAWGMTETSPVGTVGRPTGKTAKLSAEEQLDLQCKQGRPVLGVEMKIVDDDGKEMPRDGTSFGHILVRGPWIAGSYFRGDGNEVFLDDGWFKTGDVGTLDEMGFMQITDRSKDVIKSGGEWISSIDLENLAVSHPDVAEAAVIGIAHPKWDERPLLILVTAPGKSVGCEEMLEFMTGKIAKWWLPDDVVTIDEIPHTATGKILKTALRETFADYTLPTA